MNTFLGAAQMLGPDAVEDAHVAASKIVYLEGYLWDPAEPRAAMYKAMDAARSAGTKVAFTLSDSFVVDRHRSDLLRLLEERRIDILFANEAEMLQLAGAGDFGSAVNVVAQRVPHWSSPAAKEARSRGAAKSSRRFRPRPSPGWSTRPARATCSPPASSPAKRAGSASSNR